MIDWAQGKGPSGLWGSGQEITVCEARPTMVTKKSTHRRNSAPALITLVRIRLSTVI